MFTSSVIQFWAMVIGICYLVILNYFFITNCLVFKLKYVYSKKTN